MKSVFTLKKYKKRLHKNCDDGCFYHCSKGGQQPPDCLSEKTPMKNLNDFYNRQDFMTKAVMDGLLVFAAWLVLVSFAIGNLSGI